jgi:hypothetical protein
MTTTTTEAFTGPLIANGLSAIPFDFQAISDNEVGVLRNGVEEFGFTVTLNGDGTGYVLPTLSWSSDVIYVYSKPNFKQTTNFERFAPLYPDQFVPPLDRLARTAIVLKEQLDRTLRVPLGEEAAELPTGGAGQFIVRTAEGFAYSSGAGSDAALRIDLAAAGGDVLIAHDDKTVGALLTGLRRGDGPVLLVSAGQSNAVGSNTGGPNPASPRVKTWDADLGIWGGSNYLAAPWSGGAPDGNGGNNNFTLAAAHRIADETGRKVYIVHDAVGGTSIDAWVATGTASPRYAALKEKIEDALATPELSGKATIDALIWSQGEEDAQDSFATHLTNLALLNAQLRAEAWMDDYTPVFATGMSDLHDRYEVAPALRYYCSKSGPGWRYISTKGLPTSDNTHFTGPALWEAGYNRLGPAIVAGVVQGEEIDQSPFYSRGAGRLTQASVDAIATFDNLINWSSRTSGPGYSETLVGDGVTTVFRLWNHGTIFSVTVGGAVKTSPTDYSVAAIGTRPRNITFTTAPANAAEIVVSYHGAVSGPAAVGSISWGQNCYCDASYAVAGGYQTYVAGGALYAFAWGREHDLDDNADASAALGYGHTLSGLYQFAAGRGHTLTGSGHSALGQYSKYADGTRSFQFGIGANAAAGKNAIGVNAAQGNVEILCPSTAVDPGQNSELTFKLTTNTNLQIRVRGTDGVVRSGNVTLA